MIFAKFIMMGPNFMGPNFMGPNFMGPNFMGPNFIMVRLNNYLYIYYKIC